MGKSPTQILAELQANMPKLQEALPNVMTDFTKKLNENRTIGDDARPPIQ